MSLKFLDRPEKGHSFNVCSGVFKNSRSLVLIFKNTYFVELLLLVTKDELFNLLLEYQNKFTTTLASIENDSGNLRKDFKKLSLI